MILDCTRDTCFGISRHAHFKNFGYALLTLFRVSTGDNWSGLLKVKNDNNALFLPEYYDNFMGQQIFIYCSLRFIIYVCIVKISNTLKNV